MKKNTILLLIVSFFYSSQAQIGINTTTPSSTLHIEGNNTDVNSPDGVLLPTLSIVELEAKITASTYGASQNGALVFIDDVSAGSTITQTSGITSPGIYYYDSTLNNWLIVGENKLWSTSGNAGTDDTEDFIGTRDGEALNFRVNNTKAGRIGFSDGSVFLGIGAGATDDLTSNNNTFVGHFSGTNTSTGFENVGVGYYALRSNTLGAANTAVGAGALNANKTGDYNSGFGHLSLNANVTGEFNTANGFFSQIDNESGNRNTSLGARTLSDNTVGSDNVAIGYAALQSNTSNGNTAVGYEALNRNTSGNENTATGYHALFFNQTGIRNTAIGNEALYENRGNSNTALGHTSLKSNTTGTFNTGIGNGSLFSNTTGSFNTSSSFSLSANTTGDNNTATGFQSLALNETGSNNVALGYEALNNNTVSNNTAVGYRSLWENTTGSFNTAVGNQAFFFGANLTNSTAIGYDTQVSASSTIRLGNSSVISIGGFTNWTNVSDGRFKQNVKENVVGLEFITKLRPVTYNLDMDAIARFRKTPDDLRLRDSEQLKAAEIQNGFIAQEVEQAAQDVGFDFHGVEKPQNEESHYGLRYAEFVVPLVKAVQEQQEQIEAQQQSIEELNAIVAQQQQQIDSLLSSMNN